MKKILITGGLGFIGLNLILRLLKNKKQIILNMDKVSPYSNKIKIKNKIITLENRYFKKNFSIA